MARRKATTEHEAAPPVQDRLIHDLPCPVCGCSLYEEEILDGRRYWRCAGTWANGMPCNHLQAVPILKEAAAAVPVANLEDEPEPIAEPVRPDGSTDYETARAAMIADAEAVARLRGPEGRRHSDMDAARFWQEQSRANNAMRTGWRPPEPSLDDWLAHIRLSRG